MCTLSRSRLHARTARVLLPVTLPGTADTPHAESGMRMKQLALHFLADCPLIDGDWAEAEVRYRRALAYAQDAGLVGRATDEVLGIAMALAGKGEHATALRLAAAAHAKQVEIGMGSDAWWQSMQDRLIGAARDGLPDDETVRVERARRSAGFDEIVASLLAVGVVRLRAPISLRHGHLPVHRLRGGITGSDLMVSVGPAAYESAWPSHTPGRCSSRAGT